LRALADKIHQQLNPPPAPNLVAEADALIATLHGQSWVQNVLREMEPADAA
jgi:hypothetical protein